MYELTKKYRTIHSIGDKDIDGIIRKVDSLTKRNVLIDMGCHFCHLSIELAMRFQCTIYAVDNFVGYGDEQMNNSIHKMIGRTDTTNFYDAVMNIVKEIKCLCLGTIIPVYVNDFFKLGVRNIDFCYSDADHGPVEVENIFKLSENIRSGGVIGGHDRKACHIVKAIEDLQLSNLYSPTEIVDETDTWFMTKL